MFTRHGGEVCLFYSLVVLGFEIKVWMCSSTTTEVYGKV